MNDPIIVKLVILAMTLCAVILIGGSIYLTASGKEAKDLIALAGVSIGGLGALLAHTGTKPDQ